MPDDNRFAGLSDVVDDSQDDEGDEPDENSVESAAGTTDTATVEPGEQDSSDATESRTDAASEVAEESAVESTADADAVTDDSPSDAASGSGPAFEFDATTAKSIYVRPETLDVLEDTEFEVEMLLRREYGVRDVTGREFHDAAVRVLESHVEEVVDHILDERDGT